MYSAVIFCSKWNPDKSSSDDWFFSRVSQKNTIFLSFLKWNLNMVFIRYKICLTALYWGFYLDWTERVSGCFLWIAFLRMLFICVSNFIFIRVNCVWLIIIIWLIHQLYDEFAIETRVNGGSISALIKSLLIQLNHKLTCMRSKDETGLTLLSQQYGFYPSQIDYDVDFRIITSCEQVRNLVRPTKKSHEARRRFSQPTHF